jgi:hypothetical protein
MLNYETEHSNAPSRQATKCIAFSNQILHCKLAVHKVDSRRNLVQIMMTINNSRVGSGHVLHVSPVTVSPSV